MINELSKLIGTTKLNEEQTQFIKQVAYKTNDGFDFKALDKSEQTKINEIWSVLK